MGRPGTAIVLDMELSIPLPPQFGFKRTVLSHGWYDLPPFHFDRPTWTLSRVLTLDAGAPVEVSITELDGLIKVAVGTKLPKKQAAAVDRSVRHMLRLDESFTEFYALAAADADLSWVAAEGAGRLLRAPAVFEDLVKLICTTNCSWALTSRIVKVLVQSIGVPARSGRRAFPTPEAMAGLPESFYRGEAGAGYRAGYLKELADGVASREIDVEGWLTSELPTPELKKQIKRVKGAGDYVAENILKLLGRYDGLALDSWIRGKFAKMHAKGRAVSDKRIGRHYSRFGDWNGLALWCDMTRDWIP
jgi:3-methyladenine DNA glycosylase/8-oxoguanine DNA glycosylase